MSTYLQMLCRYFKSLRSRHQELSKLSWGEGMAFDLVLKRAQKNKGPKPLSPDLLDGMGHLPHARWSYPLALGLFSLCMGTWVQAESLNSVQVASLSKEIEPPKIISPAPSHALQLQGDAKNWLAQQLKLGVEQIQIDEMDARLKVQPCSVGVSFDHPFANRKVIRARCEKPSWQYFLKANFSDEQANKLSNKLSPSVGPSSPQAYGANPANTTTTSGAKISPTPANVMGTPTLTGTKIKTVLVANQPLRRGTILQPSYFKLVEMNVSSTDNMVLSQFKEIENTELLHDMGAEQALRNYDIKPTLLVKRGQQVNFSIGEGRGFLITIKTEAQQDGSLGDQIKLKNVESGRLISGVITGLNEARAL
jgi:flagella basal body P-ring formation protein FlgA